MRKKPLTRHISVGDIISYKFDMVIGSKTPEPWVGTVVERKHREWLNHSTGRWREGFSLGVIWEHSPSSGVFWVSPEEWERGNYGMVVSSASKRRRA